MQKLIVYNQDFTSALTELDLGSEVTMPIEFSIAEIRNPGAKGGAFSFTIILPSTPTNNQFFGGVSDANTTYDIFNPNFKTNVILTIDGEEFIFILKLARIALNDKGLREYHILLSDTAVDLWTEISNYLVCGNEDLTKDVDLSAMNHVYNLTNIQNSWTVTDTTWEDVGYYYPLLWIPKTVADIEDFQPAIYHKRLLTEILALHGFTASGTLFSDEHYARNVIPYTGASPETSVALANERAFQAGRASGDGLANSITQTGLTSGTFTALAGSTLLSNESDGEFNDPNGVWNANNVYTAPNSGRFYFSYNMDTLATQLSYTITNNALIFSTPFSHRTELFLQAQVRNDSGILQYTTDPVNVGVAFMNIPIAIDGSFTSGGAIPSEEQLGEVNFFVSSVDEDVENAEYFELQEDWTITFLVRAQSEGVRRFNGEIYTGTRFVRNSFRVSVNPGCFIRCRAVQSPVAEFDTIDMCQFIPAGLQQKDLITDIIARYNCYIYSNPVNSQDIVFDIGEDFNTSGSRVDWSGLKDNNSEDILVHSAELQDKQLMFTYTEAEDVYNERYTDITNDVYGEFEFEFASEVIGNETKTISTPFEPTPMKIQDRPFTFSGDAAEHAAIAELSGVHRPVVPLLPPNSESANFRVLYASGSINPYNIMSDEAYFVLRYRASANSIETSVISPSTYPYAGHYDNPAVPTHDLNFGGTDFLFDDFVLDFSNYTNAYELYWANYTRQLSEGKLLTNFFYLRSQDIARIKQEPDTQIWVNNQYWLVNKMTVEANDNLRLLTEVELISIEAPLAISTGEIVSIPSTGVDISLPETNGRIDDIYMGANTVGDSIYNTDVLGSGNVIGDVTKNVKIVGENNLTGNGLSNITINGNNNRVFANNVTIINSNDYLVTTNNVTIINDVLYLNGHQIPVFNLVEGGLNTLRESNAEYDINLIDGLEDANSDPFDTSPFKLIDGELEASKSI